MVLIAAHRGKSKTMLIRKTIIPKVPRSRPKKRIRVKYSFTEEDIDSTALVVPKNTNNEGNVCCD